MLQSVELEVITKILQTENEEEREALLAFDESYYSVFKNEIRYIHSIHQKYNVVPSAFDFCTQFPAVTLVGTSDSIDYLIARLKKNKQHIILLETFNKIKDLGEGDVGDAWKYLQGQCERAESLDEVSPMNIVSESKKRANQVVEYNKQKRIPTGFKEIDELMYGGLSTVEELLVLIARTNAGKSWCCSKMMESAQKNGFPVAYYSPEMQSAFLATRFDTWRGHFKNNELFRGKYSPEYLDYIEALSQDTTPAYIIEDKDFPDGVSARSLGPFIKKHEIKLLVIDGISYMKDDENSSRDQEKYKNIAGGLFKLSKKYGCAVVLVMQANREVKNKDDKGESIPDLYNAEGSDQPARIATQAFGIRQIFDKHVLDIKLLKTRMANNTNPVMSYAWDVNTGNMNFIPNSDSGSGDSVSPTITPDISITSTTGVQSQSAASSSLVADDLGDDDVEF